MNRRLMIGLLAAGLSPGRRGAGCGGAQDRDRIPAVPVSEAMSRPTWQSRPLMRKPVALGTCFAAAVASGSCSPPRDRTLALGTLLRVPRALYMRVTIHGLL